MEYIHLALALHSIGKDITVDNIKKMVTSVGGKADEAQIKALIAVLEDVNIDEAIKSAPVGMAAAPAAGAPAASSGGSSAPAQEEAKEEEESGDDMGLDSLFG